MIVHTQPFYMLGSSLVIQISIIQAVDSGQLLGHGEIRTQNNQFG